MTSLRDVIKAIEELAPPALAEGWDNGGLQIGDPAREVRGVLVVLDPLPSALGEAADKKADLIVSHHPLFFGPVRSLDLGAGVGKFVEGALARSVALYSAHTSLDKAMPGVSDGLAGVLKLKRLRPLDPAADGPQGAGLGRVGELPRTMTAAEAAKLVKAALGAKKVRLVGDGKRVVNRVAVCGGSGSSLIEAAAGSGAELFVTGDVKYHDALLALERGLGVLDVGHFHSERQFIPEFARMLRKALKKRGLNVPVHAGSGGSEPWAYL